ncbi:mucosal pentraxin-like [Rhineura floridana]|uniref:mucosal pentraxin-like n=1 Tax=Rhineura floridana TaxID=261503 RepID=UPI002AC86AD5|nr:mucosal pentraxin-like [Rhineura floridana]
MKKMLIPNILESFGQNGCAPSQPSGSGLAGKELVFPQASDTACAIMKAALTQPLTSFTICLAHYSQLTRPYAIFSYATPASNNDILIYKPKPNQYSLYVGCEGVTFSAPETQPIGGEVLCTSWDSAKGLANFWVNAKQMPQMVLKKGYSICAEASIVLGQDQDSMGGGFDINQSYVGQLRDVRFWDRVLTYDELQDAFFNIDVPGGYVFNWKTVSYELKGNVIVKPAGSP